MSILVMLMDLRRVKASLAVLPWMPRAFLPHPEPRPGPSGASRPFLSGVRFALPALVLVLGGMVLWSTPTRARPSR